MEKEINEDKIFEELDNLAPTQEDFIKRRIYHYSFARIIYWLWNKSRNNDFICAKDLSKYTKLTMPRNYSILNELCSVDIMEKRHKGNLAEYWFVKNNTKPVIEKYLEEAKKTLELI